MNDSLNSTAEPSITGSSTTESSLAASARTEPLVPGIESKRYQKSFHYWQQQLTQVSGHCNLPVDRPHWRLQSQQTQSIAYQLDNTLTINVDNFCQRHDVSLFSLTQSVFALLLSRYTMQKDILVGTYTLDKEGLQNKLVIRSSIDFTLSARAFIANNETIITHAHEHSLVPFEALVKAFTKDSASDKNPFFQVMFNLADKRVEKLPPKLDAPSSSSVQVKNYIEVVLDRADGQLLMYWQYLEELLDAQSIQRMAENYEHLLTQVVAQPDKTIGQLSALAASQKQYIDALWNHKFADQDNRQSVIELFLQQVAKQPDKNAICCDNNSITYRLLSERSEHLAKILIAQNIHADELVGVYLDDPIERVIAVLAILRAGAAYLPFDNLLHCQREHYILQSAKPKALIGHNQAINAIDAKAKKELSEGLGGIQLIDYHHAMQAQMDNSAAYSLLAPRVDSLAYVIYTSGSQGKPNGVMGTHTGITNRVLWSIHKFGVKENQVHCQLSSFSHVDHVAEVFQALAAGSLLVIPKSDIRNNPGKIADLIAKYKVTRLGILPSVLKQLLADARYIELSQSLREIFCSGEILHCDTTQACCIELPACRLFNIYGSTEVGADASYYEVQSPYNDYWQTLFSNNHNAPQLSAPVNDSGFKNSDFNNSGFHNLVTSNAQRLITETDVGLETLKQAFVSADIPKFPTAIENYVQLLKKDILPYAVNVSSPRYIGHMTSALPQFVPEFSKELIALNQNLVKIETSKAFTFIERQVLAMLHKLCFNALQYDSISQSAQTVLGVFTGGGTVSNITALWCARNHALLKTGIAKEDLQKKGSVVAALEAGFSDCVIIASPLAHYSLKKAASLLGIGENNVIRVKQDANQALDMEHLKAIVTQCQQDKRLIIAMVGIAGATETGTIDPLVAMAEIAQQHRIHFHVDAAWGGSLLFSSQHRQKIRGIEQADTVTICAHKQLYMPQGISVCLIKDPQMIHGSSIHAEYQGLKNSYDLGQYSLEGSRPANSMVLHAALYLLSQQGYGKLVDYSMTLADEFSRMVVQAPGFELVGEPQINIVNYCYIPAAIRKSAVDYNASERYQISEAVEKIQQQQFIRGHSFVSKTRIVHPAWGEEKITVFRVVLSNPLTTTADLQAVIKDQLDIAHQLIEQQTWQEASLIPPDSLPTDSLVQGKQPLEQDAQYKIPIGQPIDNTQLYILDQHGNEVPLGGIGEIYIAGAGLAKGYWHNRELSEQKFLTTSAVAARLYRTGDLGRINSHNELEYLGRTDAQLKIQGVRIDLAEIEMILHAHPGIKHAAVINRHTAHSSDAEIYAFISVVENAVKNEGGHTKKHRTKQHRTKQQPDTSQQAIVAYLKQQLPVEMIPTQLFFMAQLPTLPNGKIHRQALEQHAALN
ncbi:aminotransferase class V-fold PLP-dependent enzyme [Agarilytica rhodophyticola]|uniref:aminotransferase class V-fold PLP-dependent enzyme n=1 Tax=Agarilytica rhodophyticola TaxID=1737490 RepID=UPI000B3441E8|nr:aminotransferase class V-fold PLP-dependent enzyme [Agarilytica rhodophyticola]